MENQCYVPPAKIIINTDYWCLLLFLGPIIFAVFAGGLVVTGNLDVMGAVSNILILPASDWGRESTFVLATLTIVVLGPPLLVIRIRKIRLAFREGVEAGGEVVLFRQFRDRGRIEFEFEHEGEIIRAANPVHLSRAVKDIYLGQAVTVVYLPQNPKSAYIKEIFQ